MARNVPKKRIRMTLYTPGDEASGPKKIIINTHRGLPLKHELEISLDVTLSVTPQLNFGGLEIVNLPRNGRHELTGVIHRELDYSNDSILFTGPGGFVKDPNKGVITGSELFPDGKCRTETIRNGHAYIEIDAGVDMDVGRVFEGSSSDGYSTKVGTEWSTRLQIADGLSTMIGNHARERFPPGATMYEVLRTLVKVMGLGLGNLTQGTVAEVFKANGGSTFPNGFRTRGDAREIMHRLVTLSGGEWFVDRGLFYLVRKGQSLPVRPVVLSRRSGLIREPEAQEGGGVFFEHRFNRDIRQGRPVTLETVNFSGTYRCEYVRHVINNRLGLWRSMGTLRSPSFIERLAG